MLYNAMQCNKHNKYNTIKYDTIQYNAIHYNAMQCNTNNKYNTIQYKRYDTTQCDTIQHNTMCLEYICIAVFMRAGSKPAASN